MDVRSSDRTRERDRADLRDAVALNLAISVVGMSFGALATAAGVPVPMIVAMSVLVLSGGAQFLAVAVVAAGGSLVAAVAGALLLSLRHFPFGLAVGHVVGDRWPTKVLGAHLLIDEVVAFSRARGSGSRARRAYWVTGALLFTFWNLGTVLGVVAGAAIPDPGVLGIDAAFPAALLALLLPALRRPDAGDTRRVGVVAAVVAVVTTPLLAPGLPVISGLLGLAAAPLSGWRGGLRRGRARRGVPPSERDQRAADPS